MRGASSGVLELFEGVAERRARRLGTRATLTQLVDSITHAVNKIDMEHVGIASDFNHAAESSTGTTKGSAKTSSPSCSAKVIQTRTSLSCGAATSCENGGEAQKSRPGLPPARVIRCNHIAPQIIQQLYGGPRRPVLI
jgi:hypothetical protein